MLVLTRKKGESIIIDHDIEITVMAIEGEQIKIGINAPKNKEILRKEIYVAIQEENQAAANQSVNIDLLKGFLEKKEEK